MVIFIDGSLIFLNMVWHCENNEKYWCKVILFTRALFNVAKYSKDKNIKNFKYYDPQLHSSEKKNKSRYKSFTKPKNFHLGTIWLTRLNFLHKSVYLTSNFGSDNAAFEDVKNMFTKYQITHRRRTGPNENWIIHP